MHRRCDIDLRLVKIFHPCLYLEESSYYHQVEVLANSFSINSIKVEQILLNYFDELSILLSWIYIYNALKNLYQCEICDNTILSFYVVRIIEVRCVCGTMQTVFSTYPVKVIVDGELVSILVDKLATVW